MKKNNNCVAIYSRKSRFTGKGDSCQNQIELCREHIQQHFKDTNEIIVYEDEGFSGGDLNRPDFKKMMADAKNRKFKALVVYRLDRVSRNVCDFAGLIEELSRLDIKFVSLKEQFDTSTALGRSMMFIASTFSQLERETIAERIRDNMHELAKTGRWLGGTLPTGYESESIERITIDRKSRKLYKLKLIPDEAEIVKLIYQLYLQFESLTLTEAELMKRGILTKNGNYYTRFSIKAILLNPVYLIADKNAYDYFVKIDVNLYSSEEEFVNSENRGIMAYNRTKQKKGQTTEYLPPTEWIISIGMHQGIIPFNTWGKVQELLERNKDKSYKKANKSNALLTGIIYCSCGSRMYPKLTKGQTENGQPYFSYVCNMKMRSKRQICDVPNVDGNRLDAEVIEQLKQCKMNKNKLYQKLKFRSFDSDGNNTKELLLRERKAKRENEKRIENLIDSLMDFSDVTKSHIEKRIERLNQENMEITNRIQKLEKLLKQEEADDLERDSILKLLDIFNDNINEMNLEQKRAAIRLIVNRVIWDGKNAYIILFGVRGEEIELPFALGSDKNSKECLCEDSKRNPYVFSLPQKNFQRGFPL